MEDIGYRQSKFLAPEYIELPRNSCDIHWLILSICDFKYKSKFDKKNEYDKNLGYYFLFRIRALTSAQTIHTQAIAVFRGLCQK